MAHYAFVSVVLCAMMGIGGVEVEFEDGSSIASSDISSAAKSPPLLATLAGLTEARMLVADYAGVPYGSHLRHLRYLPVAFGAISWSEVDGTETRQNEVRAEDDGQSESSIMMALF